jgi:hypothetical protein
MRLDRKLDKALERIAKRTGRSKSHIALDASKRRVAVTAACRRGCGPRHVVKVYLDTKVVSAFATPAANPRRLRLQRAHASIRRARSKSPGMFFLSGRRTGSAYLARGNTKVHSQNHAALDGLGRLDAYG